MNDAIRSEPTRERTIPERFDVIDQMLFDAGVLVLHADTKQKRLAADALIINARIEIDKLKSRFD